MPSYPTAHFTKPLIATQVKHLLLCIGVHRGVSLIVDTKGKVIGCLAEPGDVREFVRTVRGKVDMAGSVVFEKVEWTK